MNARVWAQRSQPRRWAHRVAVGALSVAMMATAAAEEREEVGEPVSEADFNRGPSPQELEASHAVIGEIRVEIGDVFDTSLPGERSWLYKTANKLHIETREDTIRRQLLIKSGDRYRKRAIDEAERVLRRNGYLYDASIEPVTLHDGVVDLVVRTRDVWTLNPGINYSRSGGENDTGAQIEEKNLLGTGQQVRLAWGHDVDRETIQFDYHNPHLFDGFTHLGVTYADASDGVTQALSLVRPFYSLDTPWSAGLSYFDGEREDPRYVLGEEVGDFRHREERYEIQGGTSRGHEGRWVRRWTAGFTYENDEFEQLPDVVPGGPLPENRKLAYPWIGFEIVEDSYEKRLNQDQIRRTEDVLVGLRAGGRLGFASEALGSDRDAMVLQAWLQDGHNLNHRSSMFASLAASGRLESGDLANGILEGELRYYLTTSQRTKFFAALSGTATHDLDLENQLLLGGDNGLRGYPLRYQAGTSRALLTLEERYYTSWYPFRLFHVASAVFFDMGRTWGTDVTGAESAGWLRDVGIGLRFGSSRSAFGNVIHVDLAFPLDGDPSIDSVQFLVETKARF